MDDAFPCVCVRAPHISASAANLTTPMMLRMLRASRCPRTNGVDIQPIRSLNIHTANLADGTGLIRIIRRVNKSTRSNNMGLQRDIGCMAHTNARLLDTRG